MTVAVPRIFREGQGDLLSPNGTNLAERTQLLPNSDEGMRIWHGIIKKEGARPAAASLGVLKKQ